LLKLSSAVSPEVMPFTNYTFDFRGMIDYVFYDTKSLQPLGVLGPVSDEWMAENKVVGCPHPHIHSGESGSVAGS
jgi:CCR4-NOT transcription complex subunit 6